MNFNKEIEALYVSKRQQYIKQAYKKLKSPEDAEDAVQEAFTRALTYKDSYNDSKGTLSEWFSFILHNCINDALKDKRLEGVVMEFDEDQHDPEEMNTTDRFMLDLVMSEIDKKSEPSKTILKLMFIRNEKPDRIAEIVGTSIKNVYITAYRFRKMMRHNEKYVRECVRY